MKRDGTSNIRAEKVAPFMGRSDAELAVMCDRRFEAEWRDAEQRKMQMLMGHRDMAA